MCHGSNKQMEVYGGAGMAQPVQNTRDSVEHVFWRTPQMCRWSGCASSGFKQLGSCQNCAQMRGYSHNQSLVRWRFMQAGIMSWYVFDGVVRRVKGIKKAKLLQDRSPHCIHVPQRKLTRWVAGFWRSCFTVALTMIHLTDHSNDRVISANVTCSSALVLSVCLLVCFL